MERDKIMANPNILAGDISLLYSQASNDKMYVFSDMARHSPDIKNDFFVFMQNFYALVDRTDHHLDVDIQKEYKDFFDAVANFEHTEDDEEEFFSELVRKSRTMIVKFDRYKNLLKERGILDLVHQIEAEGTRY